MTTRTIDDVKRDILQQIRYGALESEAGLDDWNLNDLQRELVAAYAAEHSGSCWLGVINLYDDDRECLWQWDGDLVYNFGARFVIPTFDAELKRLILARRDAVYTGTTEDYLRVTEITARIAALGGELLVWN